MLAENLANSRTKLYIQLFFGHSIGASTLSLSLYFTMSRNQSSFAVTFVPKLSKTDSLCYTQLSRGLPQYQVASWSIQPFDHNAWAEMWGCCAPFLEQLAPNLTKCHLRRGLPPYQVEIWSIQPFCLATTDMGQRLGVVPFLGRSWAPI